MVITAKTGKLAPFVLSIVVFLFCLGAVEIGLRFLEPWKDSFFQVDATLGWRMRPFAPLRAPEGERTNSQGWRGAERDAIAEGPEPRIVCLGDSCTFGVSTSESRDTYPAQLEQLLRKEYGLEKADVYNFGVNGYSSFHATVLMDEKVPKLNPDVAVFYFGWNDHNRIAGWFSVKQYVAYIDSIVSQFFLLRSVIWWTNPWISDLRRSKKMRALLGRGFLKHASSVQEVKENLETFIQKCRKHDIIPILLTSPMGEVGMKDKAMKYALMTEEERMPLTPGRFYTAHNMVEYNEYIREFAARTGTLVVDLDAAFDGIPEAQLESYFSDMVHTNEKGNRLIAERLAPVVASVLLTKKQMAGGL